MTVLPAFPTGFDDEGTTPAGPPAAGTTPVAAPRLTEVHGWGRTAPARTRLTAVGSSSDVRAALRDAGARGVTARGLGRSYGDAAQNTGGATLDLTTLDKILAVDAASEPATVTVQAGVSLDQLMRALLPFGLWVPVLPGTRQVTIGGAVAADVHGKNHHTQGSFGNHVLALDLLTADGEVRTLTPGDDEAGRLFWATVGGMGLTGVILSATVALQRTETAYFSVDTDRCSDIDDLMATMSEGDDAYTYSVAWFDAVTRGKHLGRAVLTRGDKTPLADLDGKLRRDPLRFVAPSFGTIPEVFPNRMVNRVTAKAFSEFWYRKAPAHRTGELQNITQFFHPLDIVGGVEPHLRSARVPAVPVRRAVHRGRGVPTLRGDDRDLGAPVLPERAQAFRPRQPRAAVLPDARLDPDRRPAHRGGAGPALRRARRRGHRRRWPGLPGQGLPAQRRDLPGHVPPAGGLPDGPPPGGSRRPVQLRPGPPPPPLSPTAAPPPPPSSTGTR